MKMSKSLPALPKPYAQYNPESMVEEILNKLSFNLMGVGVGSLTHKVATEAARSKDGLRVSFDVDMRFLDHGPMMVIDALLKSFWTGSHYLIGNGGRTVVFVIRCQEKVDV